MLLALIWTLPESDKAFGELLGRHIRALPNPRSSKTSKFPVPTAAVSWSDSMRKPRILDRRRRTLGDGLRMGVFPVLRPLPSWFPLMRVKRTALEGRRRFHATLKGLDAKSTAAFESAAQGTVAKIPARRRPGVSNPAS
ncbi:hypothetical protein GSI_04946 [Ganoderma sinense ZZ0214-1]|uniref:Uncharacterized protein n=1 Tax=Ganoderma sinense ZZ0214-1 TaxID=1077348 RepID=A0A2G8SGD4_9APHY|nr:hypothetical protein GSI_04946 [Ganoderma sinense ZZ0214-1]